MTNQEYADSLRLVAAWFETHPEVAPPHDADCIGLYNVHSREDMERVARNFGSCEKEYGEDGYFRLKKKFGEITVQAVASREQVCKKKIVGARVVPEQVIPSYVQEIVEWECFETPLLAPKDQALAIIPPAQIESAAAQIDDIPF